MAFDSTLNPLETTRFLKRHDKFAKNMLKKLHFNNMELESLMIIYHKLQKCHGSSKGITREQYLDVLHKALDMTDVYIMNLVMTALDPKSRSRFVTMETFLNSLSLFLRGNLEEKIRFCFSVYDSHNTGVLGREVLFRFLRYSIWSTGGPADAEEMVKDMIEIVMHKLDLDRDGRISFNDYRSSVLKEPCWLEFLGQCLPERCAVYKFMSTITKTHYRY
ncbi:calaxin [Leptinotarsa decemlineata]|uniref:calaxin n=1 Tax=Leptinotarsa decemlineata TaxID=7539 RepID=UPI000C2525C3|nr:EF-hand calcium-binding domain-containing protein 1-like [Leptinotarsa decemlineata]